MNKTTIPWLAGLLAGGIAYLALVAVGARGAVPTIEFSENSSTGIYMIGGVIAYAVRGRRVTREDFRQWLKAQDAKARFPFCPFFPEFCGEPI